VILSGRTPLILRQLATLGFGACIFEVIFKLCLVPALVVASATPGMYLGCLLLFTWPTFPNRFILCWTAQCLLSTFLASDFRVFMDNHSANVAGMMKFLFFFCRCLEHVEDIGSFYTYCNRGRFRHSMLYMVKSLSLFFCLPGYESQWQAYVLQICP